MTDLTPYRRAKNTRGAPTPLVEAITKYHGDWKVIDRSNGAGMTDNKGKKIYVPLDDDFCRCGVAHNHSIRGHELLHSKISPLDKRPIKVDVGGKVVEVSSANVEVAEEYRVNFSLSLIEGGDALDELICRLDVQSAVDSMMDRGQYSDLIRYSVALGPGGQGKTWSALNEYRDSLEKLKKPPKVKADALEKFKVRQTEAVHQLQEAVYDVGDVASRLMHEDLIDSLTLPPWSATERLAAFLEDQLTSFDEKLDLKLQGIGAERTDLSILEEDDGYESLIQPDELPEKERPGEPLKVPARTDPSATGPVKWVEVTNGVTEANMPLRLPPWKIQRANRAVEEGSVPRYMHRWPTDKRVFHRNKRIPGGSILIDDSGSMGLTKEQLEAIVETAPASVVAVYAGTDGGGSAGRGEIRVVARDGKRAKAEDLGIEEFGGNGIDGPALEWLGTQPYPRIWISDGGVSDANGDFGSRVRKDAAEKCRKHRITLVPDAETAVEVLKHRAYAR